MTIAEYRIGRKAPLEWRGLLDRYVREVTIGFSLSNAITYARLLHILGDIIRYRLYILCCQVYISISLACLDTNPCSLPFDYSLPSAQRLNWESKARSSKAIDSVPILASSVSV